MKIVPGDVIHTGNGVYYRVMNLNTRENVRHFGATYPSTFSWYGVQKLCESKQWQLTPGNSLVRKLFEVPSERK